MTRRPTITARRRATWRWGLRAETIAAWRLRLAGYRIEVQRLRAPGGEVDILARKGCVLAVVEVKARADADAALAAITERQWRRIAHAVAWWLTRRPDRRTAQLRFDAMLATPGR